MLIEVPAWLIRGEQVVRTGELQLMALKRVKGRNWRFTQRNDRGGQERKNEAYIAFDGVGLVQVSADRNCNINKS